VAWVGVCQRGDIPRDRGWPVTAGEHRIAVFNLRGRIVAIDNTCLHVGNPIDDGFVNGHYLTCPWHGWKYDLRTGDLMTSFGRRKGLRTYPVRVEGEQVLIDVD
jgi:nitrite reductase (NADH) small subunit/3-phenylpropionate/trans-cinnamate dioxygenase ferredoxin subunit